MLGVALAVNEIVLVVGVHPIPIEEEEVTVNVGGILVPNTGTVMEVVLQPVKRSTTVKL